MSKKIDRATHGPSWTEVILGAALSLILGVVLSAVLLISRPVEQVQELPKPEDRVRGVVYYIEGVQGNARAAIAKRAEFVRGQSVTATESEINALIATGAPAPAPATKGGAAPAAPAPATSDASLAPGTPNVRIREGIMQVGVPVNVNVLGITRKVVAQARGQFVKEGDMYVFRPDEAYLGSLPVQRLPFLSGLVQGKAFSQYSIPDDIMAAWRKLANVTIEGNALKLTAP
jgi:hypothetical protein